MLTISRELSISFSDIDFRFFRSPGPGGQNVNKVATGVALRFDIVRSNINPLIKERLLTQLSKRLTTKGELIIRAHRYRTQERNKQDALERFQKILHSALIIRKPRKKTKPTKASKQAWANTKRLTSEKKKLRRVLD